MIDPKVTAKLVEGFANFGWGHLIMIAVGGILIYLAIVKEYEPVLLLPIGIGYLLSGPTAGHAESYEVDAAVRNWAFETRSAEAKPSRSYDFEELWLAR